MTNTMNTTRGGSALRTRCARLALLVALAGAALLASAGAASAAAVWQIESVHGPTNLPPGGQGQYVIQPFNIGDTASTGPVTLTDTLPDGVMATSAFGFQVTTGLSWDCSSTVFPARVVTCTLAGGDAQPPGSFFLLRGVAPILFINVDVDPGTEGRSGDNVATIDGGGAAGPATAVDPTTLSSTPAGFGISPGSFLADAFDGPSPTTNPVRQAGAHPFEMRVNFRSNLKLTDRPSTGPYTEPDERLRTIVTRLPLGTIGDPTATPVCSAAGLADAGAAGRGGCPTNTQVGYVDLRVNNNNDIAGSNDVTFTQTLPVFNVEPPPGVIAAFGFSILTFPAYIEATLDPVDHSIIATIRYANASLPIRSAKLTLWGVPADPAHDAQRIDQATGNYGVAAGAPIKPFLTLPSQCGVDGHTEMSLESWQNPGHFVSTQSPDVQVTGCDDVRFRFEPQIDVRPEATTPSTPTGLTVDLTVPQKDDSTTDPAVLYEENGSTKAIPTPPLRSARVVLPEGMAVSPSSANGLAACGPAQIGLDSNDAPTCPDASRIGSAELTTPLLDDPVGGSIYLASQNDNPFGSLLALYIVIEDAERGLMIKLPGKIAPDAVTGQLTATFDDNPQLPFSKLSLRFKGGSRAALVTPPTCGVKTTNATLTSWNDELAPVDVTSSFTIDGNCAKGFDTGFTAGTSNPVAGKDSPLVTRFTRSDGDQELSRIDVSLPQGLLGRIADVVLCADAAANAGTCGEGSKIGTATVGAGPGTTPFFITDGRVHMTGPYKGAPFGLSIVVHAKAGPFDLGNVVVRAAVHVDKHTAALRVVSDPLPTILEGIPLLVRVVDIEVDRPGFTFNPTRCAEASASATLESTGGATSTKSSRFQVAGCAALPFEPKMKIRVGGRRRTQRGRSTPLTAVVRMPKGNANLGGVKVTLPKTINARLPVINEACTRDEYEAGDCEQARAGTAVAVTPLLRDPLRGNVYFVRNGNPLPDMFVALRGQVDFDLIGKIAIPGSTRLQTNFDMVPDVPITKFALRLVAGRQGPVGNAANLCKKQSRRARMQLSFTAQSGKRVHKRQKLSVGGCKKAKAKGKRKAARRSGGTAGTR